MSTGKNEIEITDTTTEGPGTQSPDQAEPRQTQPPQGQTLRRGNEAGPSGTNGPETRDGGSVVNPSTPDTQVGAPATERPGNPTGHFKRTEQFLNAVLVI